MSDKIGNGWKLGYHMFKYQQQKPRPALIRLNKPTQLPTEMEENQTSSNSNLTFVSALPHQHHHHQQCVCHSNYSTNYYSTDSLTEGDESEGTSVNTSGDSSDQSWSPNVPEISEITYNSANDPHYCPTDINLTIEFSIYNSIPQTSTKLNNTSKSTGGSQMETDDSSVEKEEVSKQPSWKLLKRDAKGRFRRMPSNKKV